MNFQQLRIVHETVRRNFNLTEVANVKPAAIICALGLR